MSNASYNPVQPQPTPVPAPAPANFGGGGGGTPVTAAPPADSRFANLKPGTARFAATIKLPE